MTFIDAPPNFLIDSNVCPKVKTMEEEGIGVRSLACKIESIRMDIKILVKVGQLQHWTNLHQNGF
jgi:hypothetical protein